MTAEDIVAELTKLGNAQTKKSWMTHGTQEPCLGVKVEGFRWPVAQARSRQPLRQVARLVAPPPALSQEVSRCLLPAGRGEPLNQVLRDLPHREMPIGARVPVVRKVVPADQDRANDAASRMHFAVFGFYPQPIGSSRPRHAPLNDAHKERTGGHPRPRPRP